MKSPELIIGKVLSPQATGFFSIANEVSTLATTELAATVSQVAYPGYAKASHDPKELMELYINVIGSISFIAFPVAIGLTAISEVMVPVVLGKRWLEIIPLIKYLSVGGLFLALTSNTGYVFLATGQPRLSTFVGFMRIIIFIPLLILLTISGGLHGTVQAVLITAICAFLISNTLMKLKLNLSLKQIARIYFRPFIASVIMGTTVYYAQFKLSASFSPLISLLVCVVLGVVLYAVIILLLRKISGCNDGPERVLLNMIKRQTSN